MNFSANCMMRGSPAVWNLAEVRAVQRRHRRVEVDVVEHVEDLPPELHALRPAILNVRVSAKSFWSLRRVHDVNGASVLYVPVAGDVKAARFR